MVLPENFLFNQSNLQDFIDCRRRFQLRYLLKLSWPAIESEPVSEYEEMIRKGENIHRIIYQHLVGIPVEKLDGMVATLKLELWWENYLAFYTDSLKGAKLFPELTFVLRMGDFRLMARFDLLLVDDEKICILDWKTSHRRPERSVLEQRMQTRVYPYMLTQTGNHLMKNGVLNPEQIKMIYWFTDFPDQMEIFDYRQPIFIKDHEYLVRIINEISSLGEEEFYKTEVSARCRYCKYRSLCDRGSKPGEVSVFSDVFQVDDKELEFDFFTIPEIDFSG